MVKLNVYNLRLKQAATLRRKSIKLNFKGIKQIDIAKKLGVSRQRINQILHPEKNRTRGTVSQLIGLGKIPPARSLRCVDCGAKAKEYDHRDYTKRRLIEPVCKPCHNKRTKHWTANARNPTAKRQRQRREVICRYYRQGRTMRSIASHFGLSVQRIQQIIARNGARRKA